MKLVRGGGVVAFRPDDSIGIINPLGKGMENLWVLPKGHVEKGEDVRHTAIREAMEELGVCGDLHDFEIISSHLQGDACYITHFFPLTVTEEIPVEKLDLTEYRCPKWVPFIEAMNLLTYPQHRITLKRLAWFVGIELPESELKGK